MNRKYIYKNGPSFESNSDRNKVKISKVDRKPVERTFDVFFSNFSKKTHVRPKICIFVNEIAKFWTNVNKKRGHFLRRSSFNEKMIVTIRLFEV